MRVRDRVQSLPPLWRAILPGVVLVIAGTWAFVGILDAVLERNDISSWDQPLLNWMVSMRTPWLTDVLTFITNAFGPVILPILVGIACVGWALVTKNWRGPVLLVSAMVMSTVLSSVVKLVVQRGRPDDSLQVVPGFETSFSFPSGHTTGAATLVLVTGYLFWRNRRGKRLFAAWMAFSVLIVLLVGTSRLYLGYHFLSDVMAGACLGVVTLGLVMVASNLRRLRAASAVPDGASAATRFKDER